MAVLFRFPVDTIWIGEKQLLHVLPATEIVRIDELAVRSSVRLRHNPFFDRCLISKRNLQLNVEQTADAQDHTDRESDA